MKRLAIVLIAILIGAAAPARAWCEATCLAPAHQATSTKAHCPTHDSTTGTAISASNDVDCPAIELARPVAAKLSVLAGPTRPAPEHPGTLAPQHPSTLGPQHPSTLAPQHLAKGVVPLRI